MDRKSSLLHSSCRLLRRTPSISTSVSILRASSISWNWILSIKGRNLIANLVGGQGANGYFYFEKIVAFYAKEGVGKKRVPNGTGQGKGQGTKLQNHVNTIKREEMEDKPQM